MKNKKKFHVWSNNKVSKAIESREVIIIIIINYYYVLLLLLLLLLLLSLLNSKNNAIDYLLMALFLLIETSLGLKI